jgi:hypothetical protein
MASEPPVQKNTGAGTALSDFNPVVQRPLSNQTLKSRAVKNGKVKI